MKIIRVMNKYLCVCAYRYINDNRTTAIVRQRAWSFAVSHTRSDHSFFFLLILILSVYRILNNRAFYYSELKRRVCVI